MKRFHVLRLTWITEVRIGFDGAVAPGDGRIVIAHEAVGPTEKGVCFRRRIGFNGPAIKFRRFAPFTLHLVTVDVTEKFDGEVDRLVFGHSPDPQGFPQAVPKLRYNYTATKDGP